MPENNNEIKTYKIPQMVTGRLYMATFPSDVKFYYEVHNNRYRDMREKDKLPDFITINDDDSITIGPLLLTYSYQDDPNYYNPNRPGHYGPYCFLVSCKNEERHYLTFDIPFRYQSYGRLTTQKITTCYCHAMSRANNQSIRSFKLQLSESSPLQIKQISRRSKLYKKFKEKFIKDRFQYHTEKSRKEMKVIGKDKLLKSVPIANSRCCPCFVITRKKEALCATI